MALTFTKETDGSGRIHVYLHGAIDENADLESFFLALDSQAVVNMRGVDRINSVGITRWIPLLRAFMRNHRVEFEELSYPVVNYANCILDFLGSGTVLSCIAPYYCGECAADRDIVLSRNECVSVQTGAPDRKCPVCNAAMMFNELDGYLTFIRIPGG